MSFFFDDVKTFLRNQNELAEIQKKILREKKRKDYFDDDYEDEDMTIF